MNASASAKAGWPALLKHYNANPTLTHSPNVNEHKVRFERICLYCSDTFTTFNPKRIYCSRACGQGAWEKKRRAEERERRVNRQFLAKAALQRMPEQPKPKPVAMPAPEEMPRPNFPLPTEHDDFQWPTETHQGPSAPPTSE